MSDQAKLILERAKKRKAAFGVSSPGPQVSQPYRVQFFIFIMESIRFMKQNSQSVPRSPSVPQTVEVESVPGTTPGTLSSGL